MFSSNLFLDSCNLSNMFIKSQCLIVNINQRWLSGSPVKKKVADFARLDYDRSRISASAIM